MYALVLCNINLFAVEVARFMALFPHYPDSSTSSLSLSEVEGSMSFCGLKPIGVGEFFTSSHDLKVVAMNCDNYLTLNLCYNPLLYKILGNVQNLWSFRIFFDPNSVHMDGY
jgi:hypothetical protein